MRDRLAIPFRGAVNATARQDHPIGTVPLESLRNFVPYSGEGDTAQGGKRAPFRDIFGKTLNAAPVQGVVAMARSSFTSGYTQGNCEPINDGYSVISSGLHGHLWTLDDIPTLSRMFEADITGAGGTQALASVVACSARGNRIVIALNFATSGNGKAIVACFNYQGDLIWSQTISNATYHSAVNGVAISPDEQYVAVARGLYSGAGYANVSGHFDIRNMVDGSVADTDTVDGWSNECTDAQWRSDGKLLVAFLGTGTSGFTYNGTVLNSAHFRSGVALYSVASGTLTRESIGLELLATDPYQETATSGGSAVRHKYSRFAESSSQYPRGCYPFRLVVGPGDVYAVGRTNQGWGPNWSPPDAGGTNILPGGGYVSVAKYDATGLLMWESDAYSNRDPYSPGGFGVTLYNDIDNPTILAVAMDAYGVVYAGGRTGADGNSVHKFGSLDGVLIGSFDAGATVRDLFIDPEDQNLWVACDRNSSWTGAGGAFAHLIKLRTADMSVIETWDLGENVSALCVSRAAQKDLVYGTDYVS